MGKVPLRLGIGGDQPVADPLSLSMEMVVPIAYRQV
jgi:hypothetical protein